ncbi:MAG: methionine--tRNA ligase [Bacteroidales bacterium]|nr:methionine--tRNA ligase [Bacteroidales bacterium]
MSEHKRTLVTCALPYANGPVHVGHLAGAYIPGDIYVRYLRMRGEDVVFVCGSDEHGVPITIKARERGVTPQDIVDQYHAVMKDAFSGLGINFDIYSRTTSKIHDATASEFFRRLYDSDKFITQESEQLYDEQARMFLTDRLIEGTCPKCGQPHAYGDQCEHCGSTLSPDELLDPKSRVSGSTPVKVKTKHWYLPLDQYEPWLRDWILEQHKEWKTNVYGQCKSWLDGGLQPRAVTRDLDWGVPVPVEGAEGKVLYVWFDAPIGYISNTKELLPESWEKWWKDPETRLVHFIGKDNIVFHCIVFPSMLKAYGDFILPENVPANEFLNLEGDKISTSRNWAIWVHEYEEQFPGKEDVLRYVLTANAPETKDNDFTWKDFQQRNNSELVAVFGNFVNRAVVLTHKYFNGMVPENRKPEPIDAETLASILPCKEALENYIETFHFREALKEAMNIARIGNKYISDMEPWKVAKTDMDRTASILYTCLQICADLAIAFEPFTPFSAEKLRTILRVGIDAGTDHRAGEGVPTVNFYKPGEGKALHTNVVPSEDIVLSWSMLGTPELLPAGHALGESVLLFEKIEDSVVNEQIARLEAIKAAREAAEAAKAAEEAAKKVEPQKPEVTFDQFGAMDIRTATVLAAERVPKTDKLLKLTIDTGIDTRTIVSGIAEYYSPEDMLGKQICILANLAPRTIRGIESKGMILMAKQGDGKMRFITPQEAVANGATIG